MRESIQITVITTGDDLTDSLNLNQKLLVVFNRALALVGGGAHRDQFTLEFEDSVLDLNLRLRDAVEQFGWSDRVILHLVPRPEVV